MKIVSPSARIVDDFEDRPLEQIEWCGRLCYQSRDKIGSGTAEPFVRRCAERGHNSVLEMANIVLDVASMLSIRHDMMYGFLSQHGKFLKYTRDDGVQRERLSGSPRAFREFVNALPDGFIKRALFEFLFSKWSVLFENIPTINMLYPGAGNEIRCLTTDHVDETSTEEELLKHRAVLVEFVVNRAVSHELARHRPINVLQECLAGDTVVRSYYGRKHWAVEQLFNWKSDPKRKGRIKLIRLRGVNDNREIIPVKIKDILEKGEQNVYKVTAASGRSITTTMNHKFLTPDGWKILSELSVGDTVLSNGKSAIYDREYIKEMYLNRNMQRKDLAARLGVSDAWMGIIIRKFGLQKPKSQYPNRKPGHGNKGMFSKESLRKIGELKRGKNNPSWVSNPEDLTIGGGYSRSRRTVKTGNHCINCSKVDNLHRHHIDGNPKNADPDNIITLCTKCHRAHHNQGTKVVINDRIISINPAGSMKTFDIEIDDPCHNFVANGIVVHNSQRYVRYDGNAEFVRPLFFDEDLDAYSVWLRSVQDAESAYTRLRTAGHSPQAARTVLPNSTKTQLVVLANLEQWKHMLTLRTSKACDPSMREVMVPLAKQFAERWPAIFGGIVG